VTARAHNLRRRRWPLPETTNARRRLRAFDETKGGRDMSPTSTLNRTITSGEARTTPEDVRPRGAYAKLPTTLVRDPTIPDRAKLLLAEISTYAWESLGSACYASQATLAADLGWSVRKVQHAANDLLERGLITRQRTGRTNHYQPVRYVTHDVSDTSPTTDQIRHPRRTKQLTEVEDSKTEGAREPVATVAPTGSSSPAAHPPETFEGRLQSWHAQELRSLSVQPPKDGPGERRAATAIREQVKEDPQKVKDALDVALRSPYLASQVRTLAGLHRHLNELLLKAAARRSEDDHAAGVPRETPRHECPRCSETFSAYEGEAGDLCAHCQNDVERLLKEAA
jgi:hypothetical protein